MFKVRDKIQCILQVDCNRKLKDLFQLCDDEDFDNNFTLTPSESHPAIGSTQWQADSGAMR